MIADDRDLGVVSYLAKQRFRFVTEQQLQEGIGAALTAGGYSFDPEVRLSRRDRVDFLVGGLGIETKVNGTVAAVDRQLARYAESELIEALLLITSCARHGRVKREIAGKRVFALATYGVPL